MYYLLFDLFFHLNQNNETQFSSAFAAPAGDVLG